MRSGDDVCDFLMWVLGILFLIFSESARCRLVSVSLFIKCLWVLKRFLNSMKSQKIFEYLIRNCFSSPDGNSQFALVSTITFQITKKKFEILLIP